MISQFQRKRKTIGFRIVWCERNASLIQLFERYQTITKFGRQS